jgi:hypothetical protein
MSRLPTKHSAAPAKPFSSPSEALRKRTPAINGLGQTTRFDHVGVHPQLNLPRNSQDLPVWNAQVGSRLIDIPGAVSRPWVLPSAGKLRAVTKPSDKAAAIVA